MKKLGNPTPQNYVYSTVKVLLERIAPVMIDSVAIQELVSFVSDAVKGTGQICDEIPNATENGMKLLLVGREIHFFYGSKLLLPRARPGSKTNFVVAKLYIHCYAMKILIL